MEINETCQRRVGSVFQEDAYLDSGQAHLRLVPTSQSAELVQEGPELVRVPCLVYRAVFWREEEKMYH